MLVRIHLYLTEFAIKALELDFPKSVHLFFVCLLAFLIDFSFLFPLKPEYDVRNLSKNVDFPKSVHFLSVF